MAETLQEEAEAPLGSGSPFHKGGLPRPGRTEGVEGLGRVGQWSCEKPSMETLWFDAAGRKHSLPLQSPLGTDSLPETEYLRQNC